MNISNMLKQLNVSNILTIDKGVIAGVGATLGPIITHLYGGGRDNILELLCLVVILDWLTGIGASLKDKTYTSEYGINGIMRTLFILMFPAFANLVDHAFGTPGFIFYGVTFGLIYHIWNSMTANAIRAGWDKWIPQSVINFVSSEIQAKAERAMNRKTVIQSKEEEMSSIIEENIEK
jgi:toxin secretion/phage lysis holin